MFVLTTYAQDKSEKFLLDFNKATIKQKIHLTARLSPTDLKTVHPQIKDTLEKIKSLIYFKSQYKEGHFLFDIIAANLEQANQNYSKAVFYAETSLQNHASTINDSLMCYSVLKNSYFKIQNYVKAYEINSKMERMWPRKSDTIELFFGPNKSSIYANMGFTKKAITERRLEFAKQNARHDTDVLIPYYNALGVYFNKLKNSDSAAHYFLKIEKILSVKKYPESKKKHYEFIRGLARGNLGLSYFNSGKVDAAIPLLKGDVYYSLQNEKYESAFKSYLVLAECYIKLNRAAIAKNYLDTAQNLMRIHLKDAPSRLNLLYLQSQFYQTIGNYKAANIYFNDYFKLKDSITLIEKEQNLINAEIAFKIEETEQELAQKIHVIEQKRLNEATQRTFKAYSFAGILLLLIIILFLILNNIYSKKREKELFVVNEKIHAQNSQIELALKEKELLIKEIHHRVKNNLQIITSMLSLQIGKEEGSGSESILQEAKQRIDSIALTHQMLYQKDNLSHIIIGDYIQNLVRQIESSLPTSGIKLTTIINNVERRINIDNAVPLGLLLNELLTNAYKHAFVGRNSGIITVTLNETDSDCVVAVKDNGVGLPENYYSPENKSMGMDLIFILADQLSAELKVESTNNGSKFILYISKSKLFQS